MAEINDNVSGQAIHQDGAEHIKDRVFDDERRAGSDDFPPPQQQEAFPNPNPDSSTRDDVENTSNSIRDDNENINLPNKETSGENQDKPPQHEKSKSKGSSMENRDSIPTAGGQKLGEKHWGESSIVPEMPPKQESEAGVASKDGQPTSETANNTAANSGGASGGSGQEGEGKESLTDKIKDKLHLGKKE